MKFRIFSAHFLLVVFFTSALVAQDFKNLTYRTVGPARGGRVTTVTGTPSLPGTFLYGCNRWRRPGNRMIMELHGKTFLMAILKRLQ